MDVKEAIEARRAYRSLDKVLLPDTIVDDLSEAAKLAPSCFNNQPWRFVFVKGREQLEALKRTLNKGNEWAYEASMIIAAFAMKETDCTVKGREYFMFDTGMACAMIMLRATELGLIAHPIVGFDEEAAKKVIGIVDPYRIAVFIIVGKRSGSISPVLSEKQIEAEMRRPERMAGSEFVFIDKVQ